MIHKLYQNEPSFKLTVKGRKEINKATVKSLDE